MSNPAVLQFVLTTLEGKVAGKAVLEVGAFDVNGSPRAVLTGEQPRSYVGVDIESGPGVDEVVSVHDLVDRFGPDSFDVVLSTEMVEHVEDWRSAIRAMETVTAPGGTLLITTRSRDFPFHAYPNDYWRYEVEDFRAIFAGWQLDHIQEDPHAPGVFVAVTKPDNAVSSDHLDRIALFSMRHDRRVRSQDASLVLSKIWRLGRRVSPRPVRDLVKRVVRG